MFKIYGPYVNSENSLVLCFFIFKYHTKNKNLKIPIRLFLLLLQQTTFFHLFMCWKIFFHFRQVCLWFPHSLSAAAFFNGIAFTFLNFIEFTSLVYVCLFFFFFQRLFFYTFWLQKMEVRIHFLHLKLKHSCWMDALL